MNKVVAKGAFLFNVHPPVFEGWPIFGDDGTIFALSHSYTCSCKVVTCITYNIN